MVDPEVGSTPAEEELGIPEDRTVAGSRPAGTLVGTLAEVVGMQLVVVES